MNFDWIKGKHSRAVKMGTCVLGVLCRLSVKYCIVNVFIFEFNLSIKIKKTLISRHMFILNFLCFYVRNSLSNSIQLLEIHPVQYACYQSGIDLSISADISSVYQCSARQADESTVYVN